MIQQQLKKTQKQCQNNSNDIQSNKQDEESKIAESHIQQQQNQEHASISLNSMSKQQSKDSSDNCSFDIHIEQSQIMESISMSISQKQQAHYNIRIPMYTTSSFLKMQTQTYIIDVQNPKTCQQYQIERRYSDFLDFYDSLFYNHPGHILYPFPDKNVETFFKVKLGMGLNDKGQKCEIIEKRMADLQKFVNRIAKNPAFINCRQLTTFLQKSPPLYLESKAQILQLVKQNQCLDKGSYLKSIKQTGKSLWNYFRKQKKSQKNINKINIQRSNFRFTEIRQEICKNLLQIREVQKYIIQLYHIENKFSKFVALETQNDHIQNVCAKINSSQDFCKKFRDHIQILIDEIKYLKQSYEQAEKVIEYRQKIIQILERTQKQRIQLEIRQKMSQKLMKIQQNYLADWAAFQNQNKDAITQILTEFHDIWKHHKKSMKKIWKIQKQGN